MTDSKEKRPEIPPEIKREVRRRCGYGCIFCGAPIYQFDHIEDWSQVKKHEAVNLTLLCGLHHDQKTKHIISKEAVLKQNANPYAKSHPDSLKTTWYFGNSRPSFVLATNTFKHTLSEGGSFAPFIIQGKVPLMFSIEEGHLLLELEGHTSDGITIIDINKNEMLLIPQNLDIEIEGSTITFREAPRKITLNMNIDTSNNTINISRLNLKVGKSELAVSPSEMKMNGEGFKNFFYKDCVFDQCQFGINVGTPGVPAAIGINV